MTGSVTGNDCDVVVIGSGPGGATAAHILSSAGWNVIVLEKGRNHLLELTEPYGPMGHFSNDEIKFTRRHFLGPDPITEPRTFRRSESDGDRFLTGHVNSLPSTVGGGGVHADGKLPRFREVDFSLRSELGGVEGADVVDWPLEYSDLEPYYAEAEELVGVAGETGNPFAAWRSSPYPMPPGADMYGSLLSGAAALRHGLHPYRAPTGANSVPYDGRPACNNCGFCAFYGCPIEAKGDPVALLRRALNTGRCQIIPEAYVHEITTDTSGKKATGVRYLDLRAPVDNPGGPPVHEIRSDYVVLAGGAFETPRLLLRNGLGNSSGLVGRNLMFHFQTMVAGGFPDRLWGASRGRSVTHLHDDHIVGDKAQDVAANGAGLPWLRGGIVEHGGAAGPILESLSYGSNQHHASSMRASALRERLWVFTMQGEDLAQPNNRIDLDPSVRDAWGFASGRVTYRPHRHEIATSDHVAPILESVLRDAGAEWTAVSTSPPTNENDPHPAMGHAPVSYHIMGTARMGDSPESSVVDPSGRLWDIDNVIVADSSVFPTSTGYGPTLSLVALAARATRLAVGDPLPSTAPAKP